MEIWTAVFKNRIPEDVYATLLQNGEEKGLQIFLQGRSSKVHINFGFVAAFRMFDEGVLLQYLFDDTQLKKYKETHFSNVIYEVHGSEFEELLRKTCGELFDLQSMREYVIVTENYVVEVIAYEEPEITITR